MEERKGNLIVKSNALIESKYKLTTREQKIILYLISQIHKDDDEFKTYTLPIKRFAEMVGIKNPNYIEIIRITEPLRQKGIPIQSNNGVGTVGWLSFAFHNTKEGTIDVRFDPALKPYLLQLRSHFTSYELGNVIGLKCSYSIRLYELLKQYETIKERTFDINELRALLGLEQKYSCFGNIKQKILEPVRKELQAKTDISFEYEEIRKGRKVVKVRFIIKKQPLKASNKNLGCFGESAKTIDHPLYSSVNALTTQRGYQVNKQTVLRWEQLSKKKWGEESESKLLRLIDEVNHKADVGNPVGYITSILKETFETTNFIASKRNPKEDKRRQLMLGINDTAVLPQQPAAEVSDEERARRKAKLMAMLEK